MCMVAEMNVRVGFERRPDEGGEDGKSFLEEMKFELSLTDRVQDLTLWTLRQRAHRRRKPKQSRNISYVTQL